MAPTPQFEEPTEGAPSALSPRAVRTFAHGVSVRTLGLKGHASDTFVAEKERLHEDRHHLAQHVRTYLLF